MTPQETGPGEHDPCPLCANSVSKERGRSQGYVWYECGECRSVFITRNSIPDSVEDIYDDDYRESTWARFDCVSQKLRDLVGFLESFRQTGKFLDVGFGGGELLDQADLRGWSCWGVEVSESALQGADGKGWTLVEGDLSSRDLPRGAFDVVTLVEVVEHVIDPSQLLTQVFHLLRPGGAVYFTTPNAASLSMRFLGTAWSVCGAPRHLQLATPRGARLLCQRAGFTVRRIRTTGLNYGELLRKQTSSCGCSDNPCELNAAMESRRTGRALKGVANAVLDASRTGDTLKVLATSRSGT